MSSRGHMLIATALAVAIASGCGDDDERTGAAPAVTETAAPTAAATEEAEKSSGCRTSGVVITITGGEGVSCKTAKRIYAAHVAGKDVPKGWECAVRACSNIEGAEVRDFTWAPE